MNVVWYKATEDCSLVIYDDGEQLEFTGREIASMGLLPKNLGDSIDWDEARKAKRALNQPPGILGYHRHTGGLTEFKRS